MNGACIEYWVKYYVYIDIVFNVYKHRGCINVSWVANKDCKQ